MDAVASLFPHILFNLCKTVCVERSALLGDAEAFYVTDRDVDVEDVTAVKHFVFNDKLIHSVNPLSCAVKVSNPGGEGYAFHSSCAGLEDCACGA